MNWEYVHRVWALVWCPRKLRLGAQTLCMALLFLAATTHPSRADCPAAPIADPDDMAISFLAANGVQAASASLLASSVKEGTLVYDDSADKLKVCDGNNWIDVGSGSGTDTLASLSCTTGQIAKFDGSDWACAADGGGGMSLSGRTLATQCSYTWSANATGWRDRTWVSGDCTSGLPQSGDIAIGWAANGNGTAGMVSCSATTGSHYNHPTYAGATTGKVVCSYFREDAGGSGGGSSTLATGRAWRSASFTASINTWTDLPLTGGNGDLADITHSTSANPERMTVTQAGKYIVSYGLTTTYTGGSTNFGRIAINGTPVTGSQGMVSESNTNYQSSISRSIVVTLAANDYVTLQVMQNNAGNSFNEGMLSIASVGSGSDTLADLSCATNEIPKWDGSDWACAADGGGGSGNGVAFSVNKNGVNQTVTSGAEAVITWSTEDFDTNNNFASNRFTPTIAGKYLITLSAYAPNGVSFARIYKNSTKVAEGYNPGSNAVVSATVIVDMNGTTDYIEGRFYTTGSTTLEGLTDHTYMSGFLIGGGSGSDTLASLSCSAGQVPEWDGSDWVCGTGSGSGGFGAYQTITQFGTDIVAPSAGMVLHSADQTGSFCHVQIFVNGVNVATDKGYNTGSIAQSVTAPVGAGDTYRLSNDTDCTNVKAFFVPLTGGGGSAAAAGDGGQIQFNDGSDNFAADAALHWDNTNKRLGIGTATPGYPLDVSVTRPGGGLINFRNEAVNGYTTISLRDEANVSSTLLGWANSGASSFTGSAYFGTSVASPLHLITGLQPRLTINAAGNVGIGTASPVTPLEVNGKIRLSGTEDNQLEWAIDGQTWHANVASMANGGNWYLYNQTNTKYPLVVGPNAGDDLLHLKGDNVGIGTGSPEATLDINGVQVTRGGISGYMYFAPKYGTPVFGANYDRFEIRVDPSQQVTYLGNVHAGTESARSLALIAGNIEGVRIDTAGNVGVGTTAPDGKLSLLGGYNALLNVYRNIDVTSSGAAAADVQFGALNGTTPTVAGSIMGVLNNPPTSGYLSFYTKSGGTLSERMRIAPSGQITISGYGAGTLTTNGSGVITASSDERLKDHIAPYAGGLKTIMAIRPIRYQWSDGSGLNDGREYVGFSAQNIQTVIPEAIGKDERGYLSLQDRPISAALVNAVQELKADNDELRAELKAANDNETAEIEELRREIEALRAGR